MIATCEECQAGIQEVTCYRDLDLSSEKIERGLCPVEDCAPRLLAENALARDIYRRAQGSAERVSADRKDLYYVRAADVESLFALHGIPPEDRSKLLRRVLMVQDMDNQMRKNRPLPSPKSRSSGGRRR